jgi:hypothetical protein
MLRKLKSASPMEPEPYFKGPTIGVYPQKDKSIPLYSFLTLLFHFCPGLPNFFFTPVLELDLCMYENLLSRPSSIIHFIKC